MKIDDFGVESWINKYEKGCKYNLTNTCVGILSTKDLLKMSDEPIENLVNIELSYGNVFGSDRLRNNICSLYKNAKDNNLVITHGAISANALTFFSILEPKDDVICFLPIYQQHYSIPESIGCNVKKIFLKEDNDWQIDINELKKTINKNTKLICLNDPNNPTGSIIKNNILNEIIEIARKNNTYILCDEAYRGLSHSKNSFNKSIFDLYEKGISTSTMSKTFSLPGLRLGWIIAPTEIVEKINQQRTYHIISVGRINDYLASVAIENKDKIIKNNLDICKTSLKMLDDWVNSEDLITYKKPQAGTTAFLKYHINMSSKDLCLKLQKETGVMLLPGKVMEVENHLRIGYSGDLKTTQKALNIFSEWLHKTINKKER